MGCDRVLSTFEQLIFPVLRGERRFEPGLEEARSSNYSFSLLDSVSTFVFTVKSEELKFLPSKKSAKYVIDGTEVLLCLPSPLKSRRIVFFRFTRVSECFYCLEFFIISRCAAIDLNRILCTEIDAA